MNDPHVVALMYRVDHSESVSYAKAAPCEYDGPQFLVRIKENSATIEMKDHFATPEEARVVIEPFLRAWELDAGLKRDGLNVLRFDYERAKLVDRNPPATPPGTIALAAGVAAGRATARGTITVLPFEPERYPEPPAGLFVSTDVDAMYDLVHPLQVRANHTW